MTAAAGDDRRRDRCVLCDMAFCLPRTDGAEWVEWVVTPATPPDCEHETLDGRS